MGPGDNRLRYIRALINRGKIRWFPVGLCYLHSRELLSDDLK